MATKTKGLTDEEKERLLRFLESKGAPIDTPLKDLGVWVKARMEAGEISRKDLVAAVEGHAVEERTSRKEYEPAPPVAPRRSSFFGSPSSAFFGKRNRIF